MIGMLHYIHEVAHSATWDNVTTFVVKSIVSTFFKDSLGKPGLQVQTEIIEAVIDY